MGCQTRAPTETPVPTDACTEWSPPGCQLSGKGTHRDPGMGCQLSGEGTHRDPGMGCQPSGEGHRDPSTDRHLYRMELSAARRGHPQRPRYGMSAVSRVNPQRPRYGQTLVQDGALRAVSCEARAPTETPVWAVRRGHPRRPRYGQTLVQNGALRVVSCQARAPTETPVWAVSCQARAPTETPVWAVSRQARATETPVRTDTCTEWSPLGCKPAGEGTHRDPGTDRHLYIMEPSGFSAIR
ncbi:hypothetical protein NDU88_006727 [Pleurodeles waltl]|uniref:Uncharacterized protein n=1 Tax=Pleurodeles waltl TaxID=8319 RepID=A0AAV7L4K8_PLEWA|nr:hypothetical protein NDU88_006727 [Pleurodeles waltl]